VTVTNDSALVQLARRSVRGDRGALAALLEELEPVVVRTTRLIVGSGSQAAEDAAQEALLDIACGIRGLREPDAARAWAIRVASTRALKVARRERLRSLRRAELPEEIVAPPASDARAAAIKDAFDRLPPALRATAVLRLYVGLSEIETAEALDCSLGTVKSNLHDARRKLTDALAARGIAPAIATRPMEEIV
jgi:RNA polymerase sigma factor (sigma-70 family)